MKPKQLLTNFQSEEPKQAQEPKPIETAEETEVWQYDPANLPKEERNPDYLAIRYGIGYEDFLKRQAAKKANLVKKDTGKPTDLVKKGTGKPADLVKKHDVKQVSPREAIASLGEERKPVEEPKQKQPPRGFVQAKDGTFVPREYSDEEVDDAYFGASRFFRKGGKGPEDFLAEHPDANADAVYAAYHDYKTGNEWLEYTDDRLADEIMGNEYIYDGMSRERAAEIMSERLGVPVERARKFLDDTNFDPDYAEKADEELAKTRVVAKDPYSGEERTFDNQEEADEYLKYRKEEMGKHKTKMADFFYQTYLDGEMSEKLLRYYLEAIFEDAEKMNEYLASKNK